jgi:hypothetical protein
MSRPTVLFISQFAEPGSYNEKTWRRIDGHDDECVSFEALLDEHGVLADANYRAIRAHEGEALPDDNAGIDAVVPGGSYASVTDNYPWQQNISSWLRRWQAATRNLWRPSVDVDRVGRAR